MLRSLLFGLLAVLLSVPAWAQTTTVPRFEPAECNFYVEGNIECGYVVVPEFHDQPDGDTLRLSVAIRRGTDPDAVPVMLLSGGPGEKTTHSASFYLSGGFVAMAGDTRDFIVFDQRGVGLSEPALECPEYTDTLLEWLEREPDADAQAQASYDSLIACHARLLSEGHDLSAFNTIENAADVADIVTALGYEQVNLVGVSYGSLLAQAVVRDHPQVVRSLIIDSVLPTGRSFFVDTFGTVIDALTRLIAACTADEACNTAYPNLQQVLFDTIDELNANPALMFITNPLTQDVYTTRLTGDGLVGNLAIFLYQASLLPLLPQTIYGVSQGNYELMEQLSGAILPAYSALSRGMMYSVFCAEDLIGRTEDELLAAYEALPPQYRGETDIEMLMETSPFAVCRAWDVPALDPSVKEPVVSDVPALVLGGEFDPVTPFSYAAEAAETLSNSYLFEIPSVGHSVINSSECAASIAAAFIADPTTEPSSACLADAPPVQFSLPFTADTGFQTFTNPTMGLSGVIPEGWIDQGNGIYLDSAAGRVILIIQAMPGTVESIVTLLEQQTGQVPFPTGTITAGEYAWTMYQITTNGVSVDAALTTDGPRVIMVAMQSLPSDRETLFTSVLMPVLESLRLQ